ncbi:MAG: hypothetical protein IPK72_18400 [Candidatus Eisenbacteria bacterium]|nr:hypothetical protein [Candidatus Eisenbacteria bacterium]
MPLTTFRDGRGDDGSLRLRQPPVRTIVLTLAILGLGGAALFSTPTSRAQEAETPRQPQLKPGRWLPLQMLSRGQSSAPVEARLQSTLVGVVAVLQSHPDLASPLGVIVGPKLWAGVRGGAPYRPLAATVRGRSEPPAAGEVELVLNGFYEPCGCPNEVMWTMPQIELRILVNSIESVVTAGVDPTHAIASFEDKSFATPRLREVSPGVLVNDDQPAIRAILTHRTEPLFVPAPGETGRVIPNPDFYNRFIPPEEAQLLVLCHPTKPDSLPETVRRGFETLDLDAWLDLLQE